MKGEKGIGDIKRELFDDNVEGLLLFLDLLRKGEGQDAVVIGGADGRGVDVLADGEGTLIRAVAALFADELVALVAVLRLGMSLRGDGDHILVHSDVDVLLLEAGEISVPKAMGRFPFPVKNGSLKKFFSKLSIASNGL